MSRKKRKKRRIRYINSYKNLADSVKETNKVILPSLESTMTSFKVLSDSISEVPNRVPILNISDICPKEFAAKADKIIRKYKRFVDDNFATSHDALESMIELVSDIRTEQIKKIKEIDFSKIFSSMSISSETCSLKNLKIL